jgi:glycosyltransferase involved in cell wall biosynthesis
MRPSLSKAVKRRARVAVLTNLLAPNRLSIFQYLAEHFELSVLYSGHEANREHWKGLEGEVRGFDVLRVRGLDLTSVKRVGYAIEDVKHLHVDIGLAPALLRLRPEAIVSIEMGFRSLVALTYGQLFRRPVWIWWGGTLHTERNLPYGKRLFRRWFVGRVQRWFSYGNSSTEYLVSLGVPRRDVVELQNCVPEEEYLDERRPLIQLQTRPVLLCVGQMIRRKGIDLLLEAAGRLQAEGLSFSLLLVGSGPERARLEQTAKELQLSDVHFHDSVAPTELPAMYRSADALIFPTREDVWGLVVNEALWSGLPALVSIYAGSANELVPQSSTFDPLDPAEFTTMLRHAVTGELPPPDPARMKRICEVAGLMAEELMAAMS